VPPLEEFLQQISLYTEQDGLREDESLVTLMTLHNAKGLEYDTVFIVGCEEGSFPTCALSKRAARRRSGASATSASPAPGNAST
jgi:superfamily I DNA/RNA helicase